MTENQNGNEVAKTPLQLEAIEKETRSFECPKCGEHLQFRLSVTVKGVQKTPSGEEHAARNGQLYIPPKPKAILTEDPQLHAERLRLQRLVQFYKDSGIMSAFLDIASELKAHQMPKDTDTYFLNWLRTCVTASLIPKFALRKLINEFSDEQIEVQSAQGIGAVISDGTLRAFVPMHLLRGEVIRAGGGSNTKLRTLATDVGVDNWIKTKHGYVLGTSVMFQELKRQAKGSFELTVK